MEEDDFPAWPADDGDEAEEEHVDESPETPSEMPENTAEVETAETEVEAEVESEAPSDEANEVPPLATEPWTLPVRAAPILALQGEEVVEFPLSQHLNGLASTSLVMDEELMRIVEARYDPDGVRRLNVRMALVKEHISGYSHTHLDMFQKLQGVWWGAIGFGLFAATGVAQSVLSLGGAAFVVAGIAGLLMAKLDLHRLSFSDHGGRHDFYLSGWKQEPYLIHNSTALLGPAFVEFLRTSSLETEHIDAVIKALGAPAEPAPQLQSKPEEPAPPALPEPAPLATPALPMPTAINEAAPPVESTAGGPPISNPTPPPPQPLPPPPTMVQATPPPPVLPPTTMPAPLPPAPLPPPIAPAPLNSNVDEDALWDDLN